MNGIIDDQCTLRSKLITHIHINLMPRFLTKPSLWKGQVHAELAAIESGPLRRNLCGLLGCDSLAINGKFLNRCRLNEARAARFRTALQSREFLRSARFFGLPDQRPEIACFRQATVLLVQREIRAEKKIADGVFVEHAVNENPVGVAFEINPVVPRPITVKRSSIP